MKIIMISGPSGSGKTTLSKKILEKYKNGVLLSTDNYYKTGLLSKMLSKVLVSYFDRKISFNYQLFKKDFYFVIKNKKTNHKYIYNFANKTIVKTFSQKINIEYLVVEGIFTKELLSKLKMENCFLIDLKTTKKSCMDRVIRRDIYERGKSKEIAKSDFLKSWHFYHIKNKNNNSQKNVKAIKYSKNRDLDLALKKILI